MKITRIIGLATMILIFTSCGENKTKESAVNSNKKEGEQQKANLAFDSADFNKKNIALTNGDTSGKWPVQAPYPVAGAIFPYKRIVAYYGNLFSKKMGILGEIPKDSMLAKLKQECAQWAKADSSLPVVPALHYIAVTAQTNGGKQRMRMPFHQIDTILKWAKEIDALVFIDIQVGWSTLQEEMPEFEKYLQMPHVHFGIDPEFSMKGGDLPGRKIGTFDAADINYAVDYLSSVVKKYNIPPKILVVHRFTQGMVTNAASIKKTPEVQIVMDMDGWGDKILKRSTWLRYIFKEPVQYTGFKIFYKNDTKKDPNGLYTAEELSKFIPKPVYIQYQ